MSSKHTIGLLKYISIKNYLKFKKIYLFLILKINILIFESKKLSKNLFIFLQNKI